MLLLVNISNTNCIAERSGDRIPVGGEMFCTCPDRALGPTQPPVQWIFFPGGKRQGRGVNHVSSAKVKERVELYLYFSGPSWPVVG